MNLKYDKNKLNKKQGKYFTGPASALEDLTLQARAQDYKRRISGLMYPLEPSYIDEKIPNLEGYAVTRKMDGEFSMLFFNGKETISVNPGGTMRAGLPAQAELTKHLKDNKIKSGVFAAELHLKTKKRERIHDVLRIIRNPKSQQDLNKLQFSLFDIIELDGEEIPESVKTLNKLDDLIQEGKLVAPVEYETTDNRKDIKAAVENWVTKGGSEGVVLRNEQTGWFKIKPSHTIDVVVLGFSDSPGERKGMLHDIFVGLVRKDGTYHTMAKIGGGFTDDDRTELLKKLKKSVVDSDYIEVNSSHLAYEMVKPELVVEMKCLDMISENSRGGQINRMVLSWNEEEQKYSAVKRMPLVSIISPQFKRLREDKSVNETETSVKQVSALVDIPDIGKKVADLKLPQSEVIRREVMTKTIGDKQMVRKLLLWKTNKEVTKEYPAYVVYYTDFSTGRKNPMTNDLIPANTKSEAEVKYKELFKKAYLQGWELR
ncbi:MAG: hypothetical protein HKN25_04710 [Pyrinomonadaceae bacterium]|nr:hypothetical protein [Pyrinomonadaceae bacterium]